jgi:hypothetical protein
MRTETELTRAHDILTAVILGEAVPSAPISPENDILMRVACDVLCWALQHDHNHTFANNLRILEQSLADAGYVLTEKKQ